MGVLGVSGHGKGEPNRDRPSVHRIVRRKPFEDRLGEGLGFLKLMKIGNEHEKRAAPSPDNPRLEAEGRKPRAGFPEDRVASLGTEKGIHAIEVKHLDRDD